MKTRLLALLMLLPFFSFGQQYKLITNTESVLTVDLQIPAFETYTVATPQGEAFVVTAPKAMTYAQAGEPDLPMFVLPTIVGDQALMQVSIAEATYEDYENIEIAPSKGNFPRSINPDDVPYTYGEAYQRNAFFPAQLAKLDEPYIHRDVRGQNIIVTPYQYNPVTKTLRVYTHMVLNMVNVGNDDRNIIEHRAKAFTLDPEFKASYEHRYINFRESMAKYTPVEENGELLIICHDAFMTEMAPFVAWKKQIGRPTTMVGTSTTGTTAAAIQSYLQTYYAEHPALTDILLVGDVAQIPGVFTEAGGTWNGYSGYGDLPYGQLAGNDRYNEAFVGRFCCETAAQVTNHVNKVLNYERDLNESATWLTTGMGIATSSQGGHFNETDPQHIDNIRTDLLGYNYTDVYRDYQSVSGSTASSASVVSQHINTGVSIINYCNHGSETGWGVFNYSISNVNSLTNDYKLPYIISTACLVGKYDHNGGCFAEAWMRATDNSNGNPTGAIGGMFSYISQPWTPPMYGQDEMVDILVESYANNIKRTMGGVSINGNMKVLDQGASNTANYGTYNNWILYGDPTLTLRNAVPTSMNVSHAPSMETFATSFTVDVTNGDGALATLTKDGEIMGSAIVTNGTATIEFSAPETAGEATLTVFGYNKVTAISTIAIEDGAAEPMAPLNVVAIAINQNVRVRWSASYPATSYKVYRNDVMIAQDITNTVYIDQNMEPGTYSYQVSTVYNGMESPKSEASTVTIEEMLSVTVSCSDPIYVPHPIPGGWTGISLTAHVAGNDGDCTYSWSPADAVDDPTAQTTTASPTKTTTYTCTVSCNGQTATGRATVIVVCPPDEITAEIIDRGVFLSWTPAEYADSYTIYREDELISEYTERTSLTDEYQGVGAVQYTVLSNYKGFTSEANFAQVFFCVAPEEIMAEYIWDDGLFLNRISWTKNPGVDYDIDVFTVYRSEDGENFEAIGTVENEAYVYDYHFDDIVEAIGNYAYYVSASYQNEGCETVSEVVVCEVTSVGENTIVTELYPNPTTGKVTVKAEGLQQVTVVNKLGQIVRQVNTTATEATIDLSSYGRGVYFVLIQTDLGTSTQKIVVE